MRHVLGSLCVGLILVSSASGSTIFTDTNYRIDASAPTAVGGGLQSVTLTAVGLNGAQPNAFDGVSSPNTGITTSGNLLHQVWELGVLPTPTLDVVVPADAASLPIDTHFLVNTTSILSAPGGTPTENALTGGFDSQLTGAFALIGTPPTSWSFAQVVALIGTTVNLHFLIAAPSFPAETVNASFTVTPEPTSIGLLAVGAVSLALAQLFRRKRRST